jgi:hypothetical protein
MATHAVALGPAGENSPAHLGLSARSAETGELPHSPLARGLSGRPAASGQGRRCQGARPGGESPDLGIADGGAHRGGLTVAKQIDGGEPATAGRRRGGERRLGVCGAAVSSGGGRCSDRGAHRWAEVVGRWSRQLKEAAGSMLRRFLAADGGSVDGGSEVHESGAGWSALRLLEQKSAVMMEQRRTARAERSGRAFGGCHGKRRDGFSHGPTTR